MYLSRVVMYLSRDGSVLRGLCGLVRPKLSSELQSPGAPGALGDSFCFEKIEEKVGHVWPFLATGDP